MRQHQIYPSECDMMRITSNNMTQYLQLSRQYRLYQAGSHFLFATLPFSPVMERERKQT